MIKILLSEVPAVPRAGARYETATGLPDGITGVFEYTYEGATLATGEHNHYDDSDFYAIVWDDCVDAPREIEYASTRSWTYANSATVDATPEIQAKYAAWKEQREAERRAAAEAAEAAIPRPGRTVKVIKGRKIPVGTVADVVWYGVDRYASTRWVTRYCVGLLIDGKRVFTDADNVAVIDDSARNQISRQGIG